MSQISGNALKKLGKRLRNEMAQEGDLQLLETYRQSFDPILLTTASEIKDRIGKLHINCLLAGRAKRTKSILRKLVREPSMDLSRMTDIVGLRIVVLSQLEQDAVLDALTMAYPEARISDYRSPDRIYKAIHFSLSFEKKRLEIQVRTIAQQLWANESESFGERAKEGQLDNRQREYLEELSAIVGQIDAGVGEEQLSMNSYFGNTRSPLEQKLPLLKSDFELAVNGDGSDAEQTTLLVHDEYTNEIVHNYHFPIDSRKEALAEFERLRATLPQERFNVLILNSSSEAALRVTHPRYF
jgi:ppGpp synthetase/RelA/SpoT-type nucleotidyltranferase